MTIDLYSFKLHAKLTMLLFQILFILAIAAIAEAILMQILMTLLCQVLFILAISAIAEAILMQIYAEHRYAEYQSKKQNKTNKQTKNR